MNKIRGIIIPDIILVLCLVMVVAYIVQGKIPLIIGIICVFFFCIVIISSIWWCTVGERKSKAKRLEEIKEVFSLREGELTEVSFCPRADGFSIRLSLSILENLEVKYFATIEGNKISIIPKVGDKMLKPVTIRNCETLYYQFYPGKK